MCTATLVACGRAGRTEIDAGGTPSTDASLPPAPSTPEKVDASSATIAEYWDDDRPFGRVVAGARPRIKACAKRALEKKEEFNGKVEFRLSIDGKGKVTTIDRSVVKGTLPPEFVACVGSVLSSLTFEAYGKPYERTVPFALFAPRE